MTEKKINAGLIGFGLSGKVFHAPFLHTHDGFNLKKIVDQDGADAKSIYPYIEPETDYKNLIKDKDLDLIVVATPNTFHFEMVKASLKAGKHVIVEKPFTPGTKEADKLIKIAKKANRKIFVYHNRRWDGDFQTIKNIVDNKLIGSVYEYEAHFDRFTPEIDPNAWRDENKPGSGILYDLGAHLIDQAIYLFGHPDNIKSDIQKQRKNSPVDDYFRLELQYDELKVILTAGMMVKELGPRFTVKGEKGTFVKYGIDPQEEMLKAGQMPDGVNWGKENKEGWGILDTTIDGEHCNCQIETLPGNYMGFYQNVYDVITSDAKMIVKPEEARNIIKIIELAFQKNAK